MKSRLLAVAGILAAGGVVGLVVLPNPSEAKGAKHETLRLHGADAKGFVQQVDLGPKGFGPGDVILQQTPLFTPGTETKVGEATTRVSVIQLLPGGDFWAHIDCTVHLGADQILFSGGFKISEVSAGTGRLPVTGGTGKYSGVRGTVTAKSPPPMEATDLTFELSLG